MNIRPPSEYNGEVQCPCCGKDENGDYFAICVNGYSHAESCAIYLYASDVCPECAVINGWEPNEKWNDETDDL